MSDYVVYTDGSCLGNPGAGGWAAIITDCVTGEVTELSGGARHTTNNRMEMNAAIAALSHIPESTTVELFTDSQYLMHAFTKGWIRAWKRKGWKTSARTPVLNQDLWLELDALITNHVVNFNWVRGHVGIDQNERCDLLARQQATAFQNGTAVEAPHVINPIKPPRFEKPIDQPHDVKQIKPMHTVKPIKRPNAADSGLGQLSLNFG